jgi:UDP-N-acetylglucosamine 2-epimerase (non-hydrolysing)
MKKENTIKMNKILFIYGTRPEAIKMAPLIHEFKNCSNYDVKVCVTAQHREMMDQVNQFFNVVPDYDLNLMKQGQDLFDITTLILSSVKNIINEFKPDLIFVQGDTSTVLASALASYYNRVKLVHIEAGLRTNNIYSPFPEEMNRRLTSTLATFHFAPTHKAKDNLNKENIYNHVYVVGNTVIDALLMGLKMIQENDQEKYSKYFSFIDFKKRIILATGHRRESFGLPFEEMCLAMRDIALKNPTIQIVYPVHLNPNVRKPVNEILSGIKNIFLIEPLDYPSLIWLMHRSYLILTDSGGIQEEAPTFGKPVLVMRDTTERMEGIEAGVARLVGTNRQMIAKNVQLLLSSENEYLKMSSGVNPYGDGTTAVQIRKIIDTQFYSHF